MATDLVLKGALSLGATDVSEEVTALTIKATAVDVTIPATLGTGTSHAGGAVKYELMIDYLATDGDTGVLFELLWTAALSASKELAFSGTLRDASPGTATNPSWTGVIVVSAAELGGDVEGLSTGSLTCTMTGAPVVDKTT